MNIISAQQWLELWERGANQHPLQQALMLLSAAYPDESVEKILELSIGERDRRLLLMHECYFGSRFNNTAMCPECNEKVIDAKQKLKANWFRDNTHCKCPHCSAKVAVSYWALVFLLVAIFIALAIPLIIASQFDGFYLAWFASFWLVVLILLYIYIRYVPLVKT